MIGISTVTFNSVGDIVIYENADSGLFGYVNRVSRTKTLDGGAVIVHGGFSHADRTLSINTTLTQAETVKLRAIMEDETIINISLDGGFFNGAIESMESENGQVSMRFLIKEKLSQ